MAQVVFVADEIGGEGVEQFRVGRWVGGAHVVERFHQAAAHQVAPETVDDVRREKRVCRAGQPVGN
ncbi:MAG: hypothetical protein U0793_18515 [Gemmataceae bacterium]